MAEALDNLWGGSSGPAMATERSRGPGTGEPVERQRAPGGATAGRCARPADWKRVGQRVRIWKSDPRAGLT